MSARRPGPSLAAARLEIVRLRDENAELRDRLADVERRLVLQHVASRILSFSPPVATGATRPREPRAGGVR